MIQSCGTGKPNVETMKNLVQNWNFSDTAPILTNGKGNMYGNTKMNGWYPCKNGWIQFTDYSITSFSTSEP